MSRLTCFCWFIALSVFASFLVALSVGSVPISLFHLSPTDRVILLYLRLPRVLSAFLVGGGLALAGAIFQGLFRNPIADSYLLGVSSGASLGAAAAIVLRLASPLASFAAVSFFAFVGALAALALVFYFGHRNGGFSIFRLLLSGLGV
ncbi:MAG: iron chelate uptake ABC transporter family permease subunit, partial [Chloroflexota bacterium]